MIGAARTPRDHGTVLMSLRSVIHALRGWRPPMGIAMNTAQRVFGDAREVVNPEVREELDALASQLVEFALMPVLRATCRPRLDLAHAQRGTAGGIRGGRGTSRVGRCQLHYGKTLIVDGGITPRRRNPSRLLQGQHARRFSFQPTCNVFHHTAKIGLVAFFRDITQVRRCKDIVKRAQGMT